MFEYKSISCLYNQFGEFSDITVYDMNMNKLDIVDLSKCTRKIRSAWFMKYNPDPLKYESNKIIAIVEDEGFVPSTNVLEINGNGSKNIYFANGITTVRDVLDQTSYTHYIFKVDGVILPIYEEYLDCDIDDLQAEGDTLYIFFNPNKDIDEHEVIRYLKRHMSKDDLIEIMRSVIKSKDGEY